LPPDQLEFQAVLAVAGGVLDFLAAVLVLLVQLQVVQVDTEHPAPEVILAATVWVHQAVAVVVALGVLAA
jgi:hypothetical protein